MIEVELQSPNAHKIYCSVEILTLNSEKTLERCLESVKDFAEIIVLDGNSTDNTRDIAARYGAKIYPQYDTDERAVRITNFADIRNKGFRRATCDWFMFIDSDEYLSPELAREIREVVSIFCGLYRTPLKGITSAMVKSGF